MTKDQALEQKCEESDYERHMATCAAELAMCDRLVKMAIAHAKKSQEEYQCAIRAASRRCMNRATLHRMKRHFGKALITEFRTQGAYRAWEKTCILRAAGKRIRAYLAGQSLHEVINTNGRYWDGVPKL